MLGWCLTYVWLSIKSHSVLIRIFWMEMRKIIQNTSGLNALFRWILPVLSMDVHVYVLCPFLAVPWIGLWYVFCNISWSYSILFLYPKFNSTRYAVFSVPCSLVITCWVRADLLALLCVASVFLHFCHIPSQIWATAWDFQHCGMCIQQSLRSVCAYAQSDHNLC